MAGLCSGVLGRGILGSSSHREFLLGTKSLGILGLGTLGRSNHSNHERSGSHRRSIHIW